MKHLLVICLLLLPLMANAQEQKRFSPQKFEADMEEYITREASLTTQEGELFFPLFREMHQKQRTIYGRIRSLSKDKPSDGQSCAEVIKECDKLNIELKEIEKKYHEKMLKVLPATKVYEAINAESRFHRRMMKGWQKPDGKPDDKPKGRPTGKRH